MNYAEAVVVKVDGGFQIKKEDGTMMPKVYKTKEEADKRISQMKLFKHMKGNAFIDDNDDLGYNFGEAWTLSVSKKKETDMKTDKSTPKDTSDPVEKKK